ncbi:PEP/pyruvate-binding domain-containing protein [Mesonia sp. MT50]|uniref:Phosphoenolpyruvate synthase n=1 Tax=Mesonia profundi TaxID=3070998 RepID=A0ABU1A4W3_9FLAO|nr:PEP/pyruvate-binding domain-containing protein [Mesonia profundi]MDQ7917756.1 PEP/pyruvate-binding domain-containing protein [Mesonia profundi]
MFKHLLVCTLTFIAFTHTTISIAQKVSNDEIKSRIENYKELIRGPYKKIEWFCDDGTTRDSKDPCPDKIGGIQHASYKAEIEELHKKNHLFFADILAYTNKNDFWDASQDHSRLKQYMLNKYLNRVDDGWIMRRAQFYRGSVQSEDEQEWGKDFYNWLLASDSRLQENFLLIKQSTLEIPHNDDTPHAQIMRTLSKTIAEENPKFMDIRTKIHGQPTESDIQLVEDFSKKHEKDLQEDIKKDLDSLTLAMKTFYAPVNLSSFNQDAKVLPAEHYLRTKLEKFAATSIDSLSNIELLEDSSSLMCDIRTQIYTVKSSSDRLQMLDVLNDLEAIVFKNASKWEPKTLQEQIYKVYVLAQATASAGYIEWWEWNKIESKLLQSNSKNTSLEELGLIESAARSQVEWSASLISAIYEDDINIYAGFEPKIIGFTDNVVRSSIALKLGETVSELSNFIKNEAKLSNTLLNLKQPNDARGLNPGYAKGKLIIVEDEDIEMNPNNIYVFQKPPADLKPVAGIATVAEGNLVSHVQLLARNLGIPNSVISAENFKELKAYEGEEVFYAVSPKGTIILKEVDDMNDEEEGLFDKKSSDKKESKIAVPIDKINIEKNDLLNLTEIDAKSSGIYCGPKAANLGQLKAMFPNNVVNGSVIPFGIFKAHMNQPMPLQSGSYWDYLKATFAEAEEMRKDHIDESEIEQCQLDRLFQLHDAIKVMELQPQFVKKLEQSFQLNFNKSIGEIPVFLRSDTNMEDLGNFTGAGLNLTVFNVRNKEKVLQGIRDVWASPYNERSFKWRQRYLTNPENVFPSILIIPSVDVDYSGVLITKGISNNKEDDLTVAFSKGAGGAVDGQSAESWLIGMPHGISLISPSRENNYNRLPENGGLEKKTTAFHQSILSQRNIDQIREFSKEIRVTIPQKTEASNTGPYDVELGFEGDKLWLFQIRPFVENDNALSSSYLQSISPKVDATKKIPLNTKL